MLNKRLNVRINNETLDLFTTICKNKENKSYSNKFREFALKYINDNKQYINKKDKKLIDEITRKERERKALADITTTNRQSFIIRNAHIRISQICKSYLWNSGKIEMAIITSIIDNYVKLYNTYPKNIKKFLYPQIVELQKLKNEKYLIDRMHIKKIININKEEGKFIGN